MCFKSNNHEYVIKVSAGNLQQGAIDEENILSFTTFNELCSQLDSQTDLNA